MSKKATARALIFLDKNYDKIIFIKRTKYKDDKIDKIYYVLPGGHLEDDEDFPVAVNREVYEELGIKIDIEEEFAHIYNEELSLDEVFYTSVYKSGKIGTGTGEEWLNPDIKKYGKYEIEIVETEKITNYNILPIYIKEKIIQKYLK